MDLLYPIQAADVVIYCINCGFRRHRGMTAPVREEIREAFEVRIQELEYSSIAGDENEADSGSGIIYVPDPFSGKKILKKGGNAFGPSAGVPSVSPGAEPPSINTSLPTGNSRNI